MTLQQWKDHQDHMDKHIMWPATKQQIYEACKGEDVEPSVLQEIKAKLADGEKKYSEEEAKKILVAM